MATMRRAYRRRVPKPTEAGGRYMRSTHAGPRPIPPLPGEWPQDKPWRVKQLEFLPKPKRRRRQRFTPVVDDIVIDMLSEDE